MDCAIVFKAGAGAAFIPTSEYDGDMDADIREFVPFDG
jgi:hypothetical protein